MKSHSAIEPKFIEMMNELAHGLDGFFNGKVKAEDRKTGFCLLVFPFGNNNPHKDRVNYISNATAKTCLQQ